MASNCFDNVPHENLENCPNDEINAGIATELYYVPTSFIKTMAKPVAGATYESRVTIPKEGIVLNTGKSWKKIDIMIEEGELSAQMVGNKGNKKSKAEVDFLIPGMKRKNLGFMDAYKNVPCVYAVKDGNGQMVVIGTKDFGAFFETAEGKSGKKFDENSGITCKVVANSKLLYFDGEILLDPTP